MDVAGIVIMVGLLLLISALATQVVAAQSPEEGEVVFGQTCSACHTIAGGVRVGPDLQGVTERREESWLKVHILSPSVHQAQNDPIAVANREKFGLSMPDLGLTEQQVAAVIAYLRTGEDAPLTIPGAFAPTLAAGVFTVVALTVLGLRFGTKRVEVRP